MRLFFCRCVLLIALPISLLRGAAPVITPSSPSAGAGQSITLTSSVPVTWSLNGVGRLSNQTANTAIYTAPAAVVAQSAVLGCPVMPNDSVFTTRVDALPTNANSDTWLSHMSQVPLSIGSSWGITYADASTPMVNWKPYYGNNTGDYSTIYSFPWPGRGPGLKRENGNYVGVNGYVNINDHHTVTVRRSDCEFFETYNDRINGETFPCQDGKTAGCNLSSINVPYGFGSTANSPYRMPYGSTDAAGLPLAPLSWHLDEVKSGAIRHAVRFTSSIGYINGSIWPSTTANAYSPYAPPYGARFLLKSTANGGPDLSLACTPAGGAPNVDCITMLTALQQYGMILADVGLNNEVQSFTDLTADATTRAALRLIADAHIPITQFYAVDEESLQQTSSNNFVVFSNGSYSVDPANGFVSPVSSAIVTATPAGGTPVRLPIALQGTAVGVKSNELTIAAGMAGYQLTSWVNPAALNQTVSWSLESGVGTVTAAGFYTPPDSAIAGSSAVLKAVADADPNAVTRVFVKVLTTNSSPAPGTIRIDSGSEVNTVDGYGYLWNAESGLEASLPTASTPDYPGWPGLEGSQYGTVLYTRGGDIAYSLVVPNGNYKVRLMYGQIFNGNVSTAPFAQSFISNPVLVEAQGIIAAHNYDWNVAAAFHYQTAADIYVPARVTDNLLQLRTMVSTPDTPYTAATGIGPLYPGLSPYFVTAVSAKSSSVNGIEIIPDPTAPHWAIDAQGATVISPGQNIQLYNVDWYTGINDPAWSVVSGPAGVSISATGLLSVAAGTLTNSPIVVMASDGQYSARYTLNAPAPAPTPQPAPNPPSAPRSNPPVTLPVAPDLGYVRQLTFSHLKVSHTSQLNFPATITFSDRTLATQSNGGHVRSSSGFDIILASDAAGKNLLDWELEQYLPSTGKWTAHVRLPVLSNTQDTSIYLLYGNARNNSASATAAAVWDSNFQGIYHFSTPTALLKDSTQAANTGSTSGWISAGSVGLADAVRTTGGTGTLPQMSLLNSPGGTIELWVNSSNPQDYAHNGTIFQQDWFNSLPTGFFMGWSGYWNDFEVAWKNGDNITKLTATAAQMPMAANTWHHIAYTWDRTLPSQTLYMNGQKVASSNQAFANPVFTTPFTFSAPANPLYYGISGLLDEARFSSVARSADWIKTEYDNQRSGSRFYSLSAEQQTAVATFPSTTVAGASGATPRPVHAALSSIRKFAVLAWRVIRRGLEHLA